MKTYEVNIGLYRCSFDNKYVLVLEHKDGGGKRITNHKPVILNLIQTFKCNFTEKDLKDAELETK